MDATKLATNLCAEFEGFRPFPYPDPASPLAKATKGERWGLWGFEPARVILGRIGDKRLLDGSPWTNGYGQTGHDITPDTLEVSKREALQRLELEVAERVDAVETKSIRKLSERQIAALASFLFNVGPGRYTKKDGLFALKGANRPSTLWRLVQDGNDAGAAAEFLKWANAQGGVMTGLMRRRMAEKSLYLTGAW